MVMMMMMMMIMVMIVMKRAQDIGIKNLLEMEEE